MTDSPVPLHPGRVLLERVMNPLGVSRNRLARDIDVPVGRISEIVNGKRGVTADTALRLAKYFGTTPELWMKLQIEYDLHVARTTVWNNVEGRVRTHKRAAAEPAIPPSIGNGAGE
jgi:addiction module HigA family antidote